MILLSRLKKLLFSSYLCSWSNLNSPVTCLHVPSNLDSPGGDVSRRWHWNSDHKPRNVSRPCPKHVSHGVGHSCVCPSHSTRVHTWWTLTLGPRGPWPTVLEHRISRCWRIWSKDEKHFITKSNFQNLLSKHSPIQDCFPSTIFLLESGHVQVTLVPRETKPRGVGVLTPELSSPVSQPEGWNTFQIL